MGIDAGDFVQAMSDAYNKRAFMNVRTGVGFVEVEVFPIVSKEPSTPALLLQLKDAEESDTQGKLKLPYKLIQFDSKEFMKEWLEEHQNWEVIKELGV